MLPSRSTSFLRATRNEYTINKTSPIIMPTYLLFLGGSGLPDLRRKYDRIPASGSNPKTMSRYGIVIESEPIISADSDSKAFLICEAALAQ
jgi:hypothetical protein